MVSPSSYTEDVKLRLATPLLLALLAGCSDPPGASFDSMAEEFVLGTLALSPVLATQSGYHEHILRDDEATESVVRYVLENPVRAGLTAALGEYAFAGSDVYELDALKTAWEKQT